MRRPWSLGPIRICFLAALNMTDYTNLTIFTRSTPIAIA